MTRLVRKFVERWNYEQQSEYQYTNQYLSTPGTLVLTVTAARTALNMLYCTGVYLN